jgi:hypothetical protein
VGIAAHAAWQGVDCAAITDGPALTTEHVGQAVVDLVRGDARDQDARLLTAAGLRPVT